MIGRELNHLQRAHGRWKPPRTERLQLHHWNFVIATPLHIQTIRYLAAELLGHYPQNESSLWICVSQYGKAPVGSACVCRWCGPSIIFKHFPELVCETCNIWQFGIILRSQTLQVFLQRQVLGRPWTSRNLFAPQFWRVKLWMWLFPSSHLLLDCAVDFPLKHKKWSHVCWDHFVPHSEDSLFLESPFGPRHCDLRFIPSTCSPLGCWPCIWPLAAQRLSGWAWWSVLMKVHNHWCSSKGNSKRLAQFCNTKDYIDVKIHPMYINIYIYTSLFHPFHHFSLQFRDVFRRAWG